MLPKCEADMAGLSKRTRPSIRLSCIQLTVSKQKLVRWLLAPLSAPTGFQNSVVNTATPPGEAQASESAETAPRVQQSE